MFFPLSKHTECENSNEFVSNEKQTKTKNVLFWIIKFRQLSKNINSQFLKQTTKTTNVLEHFHGHNDS